MRSTENGNWLPYTQNVKIVIVTGGAGFLGCYVVDGLCVRAVDESQMIVHREAGYDIHQWDAIPQLFQDAITQAETLTQ